MTSSSKFEEARKWVDSLQDRWRLQVLSKKFRIDKATGAQVEQPTRIRRFVEGVPWALVHDSIDYLLSLAPYTGIIYNGVPLEGSYRPTITTWKRDDQDNVNTKTSSKYNDGTYTLVQDLIDSRSSDAYSTPSAVSCSEEVLTTWHWDELNIEDLPAGGEQGVTYAITSVGKQEDGTFNYAFVKRVAKTQHAGRHVQTDDSVSKVEVDTWNNVYGDPDSGFTDEYGNRLSIPSPSGSGGTKVDVQVQENDDCTYRISATWSQSKDVLAKSMSEKDQFKEQGSVTRLGQSSALGEAPEPSNGFIRHYESQLQPDGSYTTVASHETERPVSESTVEVSVSRKGTRRTVVSRNQSSPASTSGVELGGRVSVEKTPGKLYNNTVSTWVRSALMKVASVCKMDIFSHSHSKTQAGLSEVPEGDVPEASGGVIHSRNVQMDDEGSITQTDETLTEKPVENSKESWTVGLYGKRHRVESQHVGSPLAEPASGKEGLGTVVVNEKTPGGLYNTSIETLDRSSGDLGTGSACEKTVFEHTDVSTERRADGSMDGHVEDAGNGIYHKVTGSLNDDGSSTVQESITREKPYKSAEVSYRKTIRSVITQVTDRNVSSVAETPSNIGESQSHTTNPGGTHNVTKVTVSTTGGVSSCSSSSDAFKNVSQAVAPSVGVSADTAPITGGGQNGQYFEKSSVAHDDGCIETTVTTTQEEQDVLSEVHVETKPRAAFKTTVTRSTTKGPGEGKPSFDSKNIGKVEVWKKTPGGLYDHTDREVTVSTDQPDSAYGKQDVFEKTYDDVTLHEPGYKVPKGTNTVKARAQGFVYTKTWEVDSDGIVKEVERALEESTSVPICHEYETSPTRSTTRTIKYHQLAELPNLSAEGNKIRRTKSSLTPGGLYNTVEEVTAPPANETYIEASASSTLMEWFYRGFISSTSSQVEAHINKISKDTADAAANSGGKILNGSHVSVSVSMDEFGRLSGSVSGMITYSANASKDYKVGQWTMTSRSIDLKPYWDSATMTLEGFVKTVFKYEVVSAYGYGLGSLDFFTGSGEADSNSLSASYSMASNTWNATITKLVEYTSKWEPCEDNSYTGDDSDKSIIGESTTEGE